MKTSNLLILIAFGFFVNGCGVIGILSETKTFSKKYSIQTSTENFNAETSFRNIANKWGYSFQGDEDKGRIVSEISQIAAGLVGKSASYQISYVYDQNILSLVFELTGNFGFAEEKNADKKFEELKSELL